MQAIQETNFSFDEQKLFYKGKVRDVYQVADSLIMVATDRISAFDHVLPRPIPYKGQVLNQISKHFLESTQDIVPNWLEACPDPNVSAGKPCEPIMLEMVVRGYLAGHAWREYKSGKRMICGVPMPDGMKQNDPFPTPIITPATKAVEGHDEDISESEILEKNIVSPELWQRLCQYALALFERGAEMAAQQDLILVDTKYEFGLYDGQLMLIDEIHTPDSSRYFYKQGYEDRQSRGEPQKQLSKEFVREWLMENGFQGREGQKMPEMPDEFVETVTKRYIELFEKLTGKKFEASDTQNILNRIESNIKLYLRSEI